jgi:predicted RNase H-like HicB family nuclease
MLEYHAAFFKQEDGWYIVEVVDFPGACSQGKTLHSARIMIRDALKGLAECRVEEGLPLPRPNPKTKPTMGKRPDYVETIRLKMRFQTPAVQ